MQTRKTNILITRPQTKLKDAVEILPPEKFCVYSCATTYMNTPLYNGKLGEQLRKLSTFDVAIFTSQFSVMKTLELAKKLDIDLNSWAKLRVYAVGPITAKCLDELGIHSWIVPSEYCAEALADMFPANEGKRVRVFFPRGNLTSKTIEHCLTEKGYEVISPIAYYTNYLLDVGRSVKSLITRGQADCLAFTSPSSVFGLKKILKPSDFELITDRSTVAAIGPFTATACKMLGFSVQIQPTDYTLRALASDIAKHFTQ